MPRVLITVQSKNAQPYRFSLDRKTVSMGRGSDNDIVIDSGSVSGKHAEMRRVEGGYELADLGSTNGIKYRGVRHDRIALVSGMSLRVGDVSFDFTLTEEELEVIAREKPGGVTTPHPESTSAREEAASELPAEEAPKPKSKSKAKPAPKAVPQSSEVGIGMIFFFLILAATAFFAGLSIRHQKETGETLIKAIVNKEDRIKKEFPASKEPSK